jgi:hypothetical protein
LFANYNLNTTFVSTNKISLTQNFIFMKNKNILLAAIVGLASVFSSSMKAQVDSTSSPFSVGADFYSSYLWRGSQFGTGPAFQPSVKFTSGGLTAGVWGSFDAAGYKEVDPYISYSLPMGLSLGITDYYYGGDISKTDKVGGSHAFEGNLGFAKGSLSLSANYIFNEASLDSTGTGAGSAGGDMYFQLGYAFKYFNVFVGAGDGWHTSDTDFAICNVGIGTSKTIKITDSFSIPVSGQIVVNPEKKKLFMVVGFTL